MRIGSSPRTASAAPTLYDRAVTPLVHLALDPRADCVTFVAGTGPGPGALHVKHASYASQNTSNMQACKSFIISALSRFFPISRTCWAASRRAATPCVTSPAPSLVAEESAFGCSGNVADGEGENSYFQKAPGGCFELGHTFTFQLLEARPSQDRNGVSEPPARACSGLPATIRWSRFAVTERKPRLIYSSNQRCIQAQGGEERVTKGQGHE